MAGVIKPLTADAAFFIDTGILLGISALMLLFAFTKRKISRVEGITCVLIYVAYTAYIIMRAYHIWIF
jgi:cation:H+ antiporter